MEWTTPDQIRADLAKAWDRGSLMAARVRGESLFPMPLRSRRPTRRALLDRFAEVRDWIRLLESGSRTAIGAGYDIVWADFEHRQLGRQRVPEAIVVPTEADALHLINKRRAADRFQSLLEDTLACAPQLREWLEKKPLVALDHADAWPRILSVVTWLRAHPRPAVYARQIDVAGVDTKFIEAHRPLLAELFDRALRPEDIDAAASSFEGRFGLRAKPLTVRLRVLDSDLKIAGYSDLEVPLEQLAANPPGGQRVFITENEINGLAFPSARNAIVIFGLGYGVEVLAQLHWLRHREIVYWGDIDTHGFAILDRLRSAFPSVRSLLMDRETLRSHETHWVREGRPYSGPLTRLDDAERALFEDLVHDRLGDRVRLEQERVSFSALESALRAWSARE